MRPRTKDTFVDKSEHHSPFGRLRCGSSCYREFDRRKVEKCTASPVTASGTMVVRIRLQRFGRIHKPFYRMVAANSKAPRDGKFFEILGTYNPIPNKAGNKEIRLKTDRLK